MRSYCARSFPDFKEVAKMLDYFFDNVPRAPFGFAVNLSDIFPYYSEREKLNSTQKIQWDNC
jgi:hypothetical protein